MTTIQLVTLIAAMMAGLASYLVAVFYSTFIRQSQLLGKHKQRTLAGIKRILLVDQSHVLTLTNAKLASE